MLGKQDGTQDRCERPSEESGTGRARLRSRLSYANVTASLALFVALGGTAAAAVTLPRDSVGARQIRTDAVRSPEIRKEAVRSAEITEDAVRSPEITKDAVRQPEIVTDGVGSPEIKPNAVGASEIARDAVGASEIAPLSITGAEVQNRSLDGFALKFDSIGSSELAEVYESASTETTVTDDTAHNGVHGQRLAVASCEEVGDQILSGSIERTDTNDHNEAMLFDLKIDRTGAFDMALVTGVFDGGGGGAANPEKFVGTATCLRF